MNPLAADLDHVLDHTRPLWEELRGERLFITGGTGFFGSWLLESFLWANERLQLGASATVLTRSPQAFIAKTPHLALAENVTLLEGDVRNFAFPPGTFSYVIHAATQPGSAIEQLQANISGTQRTLDFARTCGAEKILFTSSGAVYGKQPSELTHIPEIYNGAPNTLDVGSAYGQSKRISEYICTVYAQKFAMKISIARCFAFVGPYLPLDANYAIGNFIRDALRGGSIQITGDGTPYRSYLYASDLTIWLWTILFIGRPSYAYNVGSENDLTIVQLAQTVREVIAPDIFINVNRRPIVGNPVERYVPSVKRCQSELGLRVSIPLPEALRRTASWYSRVIHNEKKGEEDEII